jgi:serine/threonine protein kinase
MHPSIFQGQGHTVNSQSGQTTCASNADLWLLLHDQLSPSEDLAVSRHVEVCPQCQRRLEELSSPHDEGSVPTGKFGRYQLGVELGHGSSGIVYLAQAADSPSPVALKLLTDQAARAETGRERFLREIHLLQSLEHPGIVAVREAGQVDGRFYLAMEYVPGGTLADFSRRRPQPEKAAAKIIAKAAAAVSYCHQRGIVHRDLKPRNILLGRPHVSENEKPAAEELIPRIADFGIARIETDSQAMTETGAVLGTLDYMAPEQLEHGHRVTGAADIYSLGAILFELLTGGPPHRAVSFAEMITVIRSEDPPRLRSLIPLASPALELICERCLQKEPAERYASAQLLADDLERFLDGRKPLIRPVPVWKKLRRWSRRNPGRFGLILAAIAGGFVITASSLIVAHREQQHALAMEQERDRTQSLFEESLKAYRMLDFDIEVIVERKERPTRELRDQINHILNFMEPLLDRTPEQSDHRKILANTWHYYSRLLHEGDEPVLEQDIVRGYEKCMAHCNWLRQASGLPVEEARKFAILGINTQMNLGNYYREKWQWKPAEQALNGAVADWEQLLAQSPQDTDYQRFFALATQNWVWLHWEKLRQEWEKNRPPEVECSRQISALMDRLQSSIRQWEQVFQNAPQQRTQNADYYSIGLQLEVDLLMLERKWEDAQQAINRLLEKCLDSDLSYIAVLEYQMKLVAGTKSVDSIAKLQYFMRVILEQKKAYLADVQNLINSDEFAAIEQEHPEIAKLAAEFRPPQAAPTPQP